MNEDKKPQNETEQKKSESEHEQKPESKPAPFCHDFTALDLVSEAPKLEQDIGEQ